MSLAFSPQRKPDEVSIGYLLRLARANGYARIGSMVSSAEQNNIIKLQITPALNAKLGIPISQGEVFSTIINPMFNRNIQLNPKVCIQCLNEDGYLLTEVQNPFCHACSKHQSALTSQCTTCYESLAWDIPLIKGHCTSPRCGVQLKPSSENVRSLSEAQVSDCLYAALVLEKEHIMALKPNTYASLPFYENMLEKGYRLLTNNAFFREWVQKTLQATSSLLPHNIRSVAIVQFLETLSCTWPAATLDIVIPAPPADGIALSVTEQWLPFGKASRLLELRPEELQLLQHVNLVKHARKSRLHHNSQIDVAPIFQLLVGNDIQPGMVCLSTLTEVMVHNDVEMYDILIGFKEGRLQLGYGEGHNLRRAIWCEPASFIRFAKDVFSKRQYDAISLEKAVSLTGLPMELLHALRKMGKLRPPRVARAGSLALCQFEDVLQIRQQQKPMQLSLI